MKISSFEQHLTDALNGDFDFLVDMPVTRAAEFMQIVRRIAEGGETVPAVEVMTEVADVVGRIVWAAMDARQIEGA